MPLSLLILPILAGAAATPAERPIFVTGNVWAPFISPMGEPFRSHQAGDDTLANWFNQADRNHDGMLTASEMVSDADRFFALLDTNHDGEIDPDELVNYEWRIAPEIQVMSKTRRPRGERPAGEGHSKSSNRRSLWGPGNFGGGKDGSLEGGARYALLNIPEPVAAADADFNRGVSLAEFRQAALQRFALLDGAGQGKLTLAGLRPLVPETPLVKDRKKPKDDAPDARVGNPLPSED